MFTHLFTGRVWYKFPFKNSLIACMKESCVFHNKTLLKESSAQPQHGARVPLSSGNALPYQVHRTLSKLPLRPVALPTSR